MSERYTRPPDVLLVEDNPDDIYFIEEAFERSTIRKTLHAVRDAEEALAFLRREPPHENAPRPHLILLDLKLPKMPGMDFLRRIKEDDDLRSIPVVVLTTSDSAEEAAASYDLLATSFITKPKDLDDFERVIQMLEQFWLSTVQLPPSR